MITSTATWFQNVMTSWPVEARVEEDRLEAVAVAIPLRLVARSAAVTRTAPRLRLLVG
jgi:hypothetical protein